MRRARYQNGTVALKPRSHGSAVWVYRWREGSPQGKTTRKSLVIGTTEEFTTRTQALKAAEGLRLRANRESRDIGEPTFGALIERFILEEKLRDAKAQSRAIGVLEQDEKFDSTGAPIGVQQKLMRHAHPGTTGIYGGALLMSSKRDANSKVVRMALRLAGQRENVA